VSAPAPLGRVGTIPLIVLAETPSTNMAAHARIAAGERGPLWIRADRQTAGRGRAGRAWTSPPGNLSASYVHTFPIEPAAAAQLSLLAGVALVGAIDTAAGTRLPGLALKWPNDVLVGDAKLAGILAESITTMTDGARGLTVILGIGANLADAPRDLDRPAAHLAGCGLVITPSEMLGHLAASLTSWLTVWDEGRNFAGVRDAWIGAARIGADVVVDTGRGVVRGTVAGLDEDGALRVRTAGGSLQRVTFGDVVMGGAARTP
jgi:BirA family transcriptional regulator, biotin operon repressor / biotin---[acetyl-CoA-carboxylase] ligase